MSLISTPIPHMFNGVSQQAASLRHITQCALQENCYPAIATGNRKRPPTQHLAKLKSATATDAFVHTINRDVSHRYSVIITNGAVEVFNLATGAAQTILTPDGTAYLTSTTPREEFAAVTVADFTFIVNKAKVTAMSATTSGTAIPAQTLSSITQVAGTATGTTAAPHLLVAGDMVTISGAAQSGYNGLKTVLAVTATTFTFTVAGGTVSPATGTLVYTAVEGVTGTVQAFADLPASPTLNDLYRIEGTPDTHFDDYYVQWNGSVWVESLKPGEAFRIDAATMPFKLTKTGATEFTLAKNVWIDRLVGDVISNENPSFIGLTIKDVFFYRNRLGFISDENVVLSRSGEYFTFWSESVTAVLDSDPVDNSVSHTKVSLLYAAVPFNKALMLFSDQTQFQLTSGDLLTPKSAKIDVVTEFESSNKVRPVAHGQQLFFGVNAGASTRLREYYVEDSTLSNDASDVSAHVPTYVPGNMFRLTSSTAEDVVFGLTLNERNAVYIYKFYWSGTEKVQSSWGKFVFDAADVILGADFVGNVAYFVIQRADGVYLETMALGANITDSTFGFLVHLDRRKELTGVYDAGNNWTTWTLPYVDSGTFAVVLGTGFGDDGGALLTTTRPTTSTIRAAGGDYSAHSCYVGRTYTQRYRFSEQFVRDQKSVSVATGKLRLKRMAVRFSDTGYFRAEVTATGRSTYTYEYTAQTVGELILGDIEIHTGILNFPIQSESSQATIDLVNDSYLPATFQSAEWIGEFIIKSARR
jgi:hypothetical protein